MRVVGAALGATMMLAGLMALPTAASAGTVTVNDAYYGGTNFYNDPGDVIGTSSFEINSATFERLAGGSILQVTINTNYASASVGDRLGTGFGDLFITPGTDAWSPTGPGPGYHTDTYQAGDWAYAITMDFSPSGSSGASSLYSTADGVIGMSNVGGNYSGGNFRNNQAVEFFANGGATDLGAGSTYALGLNQLVFQIHDNGALGNAFAFSWAMTCANDVIQGQVGGVPEPASWALMIGGFGLAGAMIRRRKVAATA